MIASRPLESVIVGFAPIPTISTTRYGRTTRTWIESRKSRSDALIVASPGALEVSTPDGETSAAAGLDDVHTTGGFSRGVFDGSKANATRESTSPTARSRDTVPIRTARISGYT